MNRYSRVQVGSDPVKNPTRSGSGSLSTDGVLGYVGGAECCSTHSGEFSEEELELLGLFDHPLCSLPPLVGVLEGDPLLHHGLDVLHHHSAMGLARHLLQKSQVSDVRSNQTARSKSLCSIGEMFNSEDD